MDRLTFEGNFCDIAQCRELPCPYDNNCMQKQVWERLKAYENTGLAPEAVDEMQRDWSDLCTIVGECGGLDRVRELGKADKEGRVAVLPCEATPDWQLVREQRRVEFWKRQYEGCIHLKARVGDTLWLIASYYTERLPQPMEARVVRIKIDAGDEITYATTRRRVSDREIGKTVFLTREEAEKALEARSHEVQEE